MRYHRFIIIGLLVSGWVSAADNANLKAIQQITKGGVPSIETKKLAKRRVRVGSPKLKEAIELYRAGDLTKALQLLDGLLLDASLDDNDRSITEFFMGKVLFGLGYYYSSVPYFQSVIQNHSDAVFYPYSFQRLLWVVKKDGMTSLLVDPLRQRKSSLVPRNYRDDVYYIFARSYFESQEDSKAIQAIAGLQPSSEYYYEGKLMLALMLLRAKKRDEAAQAFAEAAKSTNEDIKGLAQLGVARLHYGKGEDRLALQNYGQVAIRSRHWMASQMESAWAHFRTNEPSLALGDVHLFDNAAFNEVFAPEASIIKSTIYFRLCRYSDAEKAIITFFEKYAPVYRQIETFHAKYRNNDKVYRQEVLKAVFRESNQLPEALTRQVFEQAWFDGRIRQLVGLKQERTQLEQHKELLNLQSMKLAHRYVRDSMSAIADQVLRQAIPLLKAWDDKLEAFFRQASTLRFESAFATIELEKKQSNKQVEITKDDQYEIWTVDKDEFWLDEMEDYNYLLTSQCTEDQQG